MCKQVILFKVCLPFQGAQYPQAQRANMHSKASASSLNALPEGAHYAKQAAPSCTPPASPIQSAPAEHHKDKILHASDVEGIKAEGQAAAMAAIAAAQAHVNGSARDDSRGNSGEYWVRSNSEEDMERADSGGLQVSQGLLFIMTALVTSKIILISNCPYSGVLLQSKYSDWVQLVYPYIEILLCETVLMSRNCCSHKHC